MTSSRHDTYRLFSDIPLAITLDGEAPMPAFDLPLNELRGYRSAVRRPDDFADFWRDTLAASRSLSWAPRVVRVESPVSVVAIYDVTFAGYEGEPVKAWLHVPTGAERGPLVVRYVGYNCGRGLPHMVPTYALAGYPVLTMDNRGQGAVAAYRSDTPDSGGEMRVLGGHAMRGYESRESYYFRRLYTDAVLAIDAATTFDLHQPGQVAVAGVSQGGGIALAAAGLVTGIAAALIDVPFLSDVPRGMALTSRSPYGEMATVLASYPEDVATALTTLSYFDATLFAQDATAPSIFSVGLMDDVCPPSTVFAAYNAYAGDKEMHEYPFNGHEGGSFSHEAIQLDWIHDRIPLPAPSTVSADDHPQPQGSRS